MPKRIPVVYSPVVGLSDGRLNVLPRHGVKAAFSYDCLLYFLEEKLRTAQVSGEEKRPSCIKHHLRRMHVCRLLTIGKRSITGDYGIFPVLARAHDAYAHCLLHTFSLPLLPVNGRKKRQTQGFHRTPPSGADEPSPSESP